MLYGNIHNEFFSSQLKLLPVPLASALRFLKDNDLTAHETGKFEIQLEGVNMILQVLDLETKTRNELLPEIHRKYIDVQFLCSGGPENAAYYNDDGTNTIHENLLDSPRDICFYENNPNIREGLIPMEIGTFAVYFPWDVHVPAIAVDDKPAKIRKIVIKVPFDECIKA